ncbi:MAG: hypothetical protein AAF337_02580 [Pseudomonadota bacterium]
MRRGKIAGRFLARAAGAWTLPAICCAAALPAYALGPAHPSSGVTLQDGQVELRANKATRLNMYLPNSGALAGGKSSAVLAADFSMKRAGTSITVKSGYHARNNKAIAGYLTAHSPYEQGWRGSLSAHWVGEADLYNDIRQGGYEALPSLELEGLHELGIERTLSSGLSMGVTARSQNNRQSVTAQLGYKRGGLAYSGVMTKDMFGGTGLNGHQRLQYTRGSVTVDGGVLMRTANTGELQTFPHVSAKATLKGFGLAASFKSDPRLRLAGRAIESTALSVRKGFLEDRLQLSTDFMMRQSVRNDTLVTAGLEASFASSKDAGKLSWRVSASALHLSGGGQNDITAIGLQPGLPLASTLKALKADFGYKLSKKTTLNFKTSAKMLQSDLGAFQRVTVSSHVKRGLWDFEAMAGLNNASQDDIIMTSAQGSLHHFFAQRAFGQFSDQRTLFSFKAKYSY